MNELEILLDHIKTEARNKEKTERKEKLQKQLANTNDEGEQLSISSNPAVRQRRLKYKKVRKQMEPENVNTAKRAGAVHGKVLDGYLQEARVVPHLWSSKGNCTSFMLQESMRVILCDGNTVSHFPCRNRQTHWMTVKVQILYPLAL